MEESVSDISAFEHHVLSGGTLPCTVGYLFADGSLTLGSLLSDFVLGAHYLVTVDRSVTVIGLEARGRELCLTHLGNRNVNTGTQCSPVKECVCPGGFVEHMWLLTHPQRKAGVELGRCLSEL